MKMPKSLVITSLTALIGVSLVGTVSSTVAWFQYATSAQVAYTGTTSHCTKLLKISSDNGQTWGNNIVLSDSEFAPITTGEQAKNAALPANFYAQPDKGQGLYENWNLALAGTYAQYEILVKVNDGDIGTPLLQNDVYLTDVTIEDATNALELDLSEAIRVHVATTYGSNQDQHKYFLFAKSVTSTDVGGYLDVDGDGAYDTVSYEWNSNKIIYGKATDDGHGNLTPAVQTSYKSNDSTIIASETATGDLDTEHSGTSIGQTSVTQGQYLRVTITIWLEGWAMLKYGDLGNADSAQSMHQMWSGSKYSSKSFHVGLTFGVKSHSDEDHPNP